MILHEKKVFRFRWDAVEKRPARGRVYIRAKRGDALTTSPRCDFTSADFLTDRNEPRFSRFFNVGSVHGRTKLVAHGFWNVTCSIQVSTFAVSG